MTAELKQHVFALTRNEQRVIVLVLLLVIAAVAAKKYHDIRLRPPVPAVPTSASPSAPVPDEDGKSDE